MNVGSSCHVIHQMSKNYKNKRLTNLAKVSYCHLL